MSTAGRTESRTPSVSGSDRKSAGLWDPCGSTVGGVGVSPAADELCTLGRPRAGGSTVLLVFFRTGRSGQDPGVLWPCLIRPADNSAGVTEDPGVHRRQMVPVAGWGRGEPHRLVVLRPLA